MPAQDVDRMFARLCTVAAFGAIALLMTVTPAQAALPSVDCLAPYQTQPYNGLDVQASLDKVAGCTYHTNGAPAVGGVTVNPNPITETPVFHGLTHVDDFAPPKVVLVPAVALPAVSDAQDALGAPFMCAHHTPGFEFCVLANQVASQVVGATK